MSFDFQTLIMFGQTFAAQMTSYFAIVGLLFILVWRLGEKRFRRSRIQSKTRVNAKQISYEIRHTLPVLMVGTGIAVVVSLLQASGHTKLTNEAQSIGWPMISVTFMALIIFSDAWFYVWHRALHHPKLFRHVHAVHHKSVDVNPFSSYSFHWLEGFLMGAWILPVVLYVPIYIPMLGALQGIGLANNVMSHLGYEFLPRWLIRVPGLRWMNTSTFHNLHHTSLNGNYGLMFRFWDRQLGTELDNYEQKFIARNTE